MNSRAEVWDYVKAGTHRAGSQNARVSVRRPGFPARLVVALINNPGEISPLPAPWRFHFTRRVDFRREAKGSRPQMPWKRMGLGRLRPCVQRGRTGGDRCAGRFPRAPLWAGLYGGKRRRVLDKGTGRAPLGLCQRWSQPKATCLHSGCHLPSGGSGLTLHVSNPFQTPLCPFLRGRRQPAPSWKISFQVIVMDNLTGTPD
ncbi:hypothetical protein MDA_GLEAN10022795 [Myotis davidii]|uniref:Uncharacterized protein n=1 Tax=Myotis davidii TaxID=225400 RepID=L5M1B2_MYODS|nr:hypothetical protein MDA_GLEAN10022795 [Myotis davidii]